MSSKAKVCLVSCSVLKGEIEQLVKQGDLNADVVFVDKYFHVDYKLLEQNLLETINNTLSNAPRKLILVYGDLCLGPNSEMKNLAERYGMVKVNALNCTDCLLGGKGRISEIDPKHELMILHPGMIDFFEDLKTKLQQEGLDDEAFKNVFCQLKGVILLDTLGEAEKNEAYIEKLHLGLRILETKKIGLTELKKVLIETMQTSKTE